jgi:hypothetical protein
MKLATTSSSPNEIYLNLFNNLTDTGGLIDTTTTVSSHHSLYLDPNAASKLLDRITTAVHHKTKSCLTENKLFAIYNKLFQALKNPSTIMSLSKNERDSELGYRSELGRELFDLAFSRNSVGYNFHNGDWRISTYTPSIHAYSVLTELESQLGIRNALFHQGLLNDKNSEPSSHHDAMFGVDLIYTLKGERLQHPLIGISKKCKTHLYRGKYDIDMDSAMPQILMQMVEKSGIQLKGGLSNLMSNKKLILASLSDILNISKKEAKKRITAMLNRKSYPSDKDINEASFKVAFLLKGEENGFIPIDKLVRVLNIPGFVELIKDCRDINRVIKVINPGKNISQVYREIETEIMDSVDLYLTGLDNRVHLRVHDGLICEEEVNLIKLSNMVKNQFSYDLTFSQELLVC